MQNYADFFLDLLFPITCVGCGKEKTHCCSDCFLKIPRRIPRHYQQQNNSLIAAADFKENSLLDELIHRFKYEGAQKIAGILVSLLPTLQFNPHNTVLVPVPLHPKRENFRGFNQSALLALEIKKKCGFEVLNILQRDRHTTPQIELSRSKRLTNVNGAFSIKNPRLNLSREIFYILIDDVYTTGATMQECMKTLQSHGAFNTVGLVIGRA